jgi:hypothetical protein
VRTSLAEPATLRELLARVNEQLDEPWPPPLEQELVYSVHGHVERLVQRGLVTAEGTPVVYRSAA